MDKIEEIIDKEFGDQIGLFTIPDIKRVAEIFAKRVLEKEYEISKEEIDKVLKKYL